MRVGNTVGQAVAHLVEATNREVAGSILDSFIRIFHRYNSYGLTMVLGSTQLLRKCVPGG